LDEQSPETRIAPLTDAEQFLSSTGGVLFGRQPDPSCQVAPSSERGAIAKGGHQSCGGYRAIPGTVVSRWQVSSSAAVRSMTLSISSTRVES